MPNRRIFVSCGQETQQEISLGREIIKVIDDNKGMKGFFAQDIHSAADLNSSVFAAVKACDGFFAVMHKRGGVTYRDYAVIHRSSVWIQQEIAIIAYRSFLQGRDVPVCVYQEKGILLEGIMKTSIVNPITFQENKEVLAGLSKWLTGPAFEEHPVLERRESLFRKRIQSLTNDDWFLLELITAHTSGPGEAVIYHNAYNDFYDFFKQKGMNNDQIDPIFNQSRNNLISLGLIIQEKNDQRGSIFTIATQWWNLLLEELRNQGR